jgi:hypothetical protein
MVTESRNGRALITGASAGIGAQYAEQLAERGYDLTLVARNAARMNELAARIRASTGREVEVIAADLADGAGVARVEHALATDTSITLLVNNAGIGSLKPLLESDPRLMDEMIQVNVVALSRLTRAVAPRFVERGAGTIVNVASVVAIKPEWLNGVYGATKAFVVAYSQSLREELTKKGIRVQVVLPGTTRTEFWDLAGKPRDTLAAERTMEASELVRAALVGLDLGEFVTIPSLPDLADWQRYEDARNALGPNLSRDKAAARYGG